MDLVGPKIEQYQEDRRIGQFGNVFRYKLKAAYRYSDDNLPRRMAVKAIIERDDVQVSEIQLCKSGHVNVVTLYGVEKVHDFIFIKMEVAQSNLARLQHDVICGPVDEDVFVYLAVQMAEGLAYLHEESIAHRNLKPENVLAFWPENVAPTKANLPCVVLKLCDFEFTRNFSEKAVTVEAQSYLAPEVAKSLKNKTPFLGSHQKADVFCLGMIFHQLLLNSLPNILQEVDSRKQAFIPDEETNSVRDEFAALLSLMLSWENRNRISASCLVGMIRPWFSEGLLQQQVEQIQAMNYNQQEQLTLLIRVNAFQHQQLTEMEKKVEEQRKQISDLKKQIKKVNKKCK